MPEMHGIRLAYTRPASIVNGSVARLQSARATLCFGSAVSVRARVKRSAALRQTDSRMFYGLCTSYC